MDECRGNWSMRICQLVKRLDEGGMIIINGGRLFAKQLKKEEVSQIFTIYGGQIMPPIYGCRAERIEVIDVRHENAGVYAADAYARMTGKPGVIVATVTPGVLQTMQGIAEGTGSKHSSDFNLSITY